MFKPAKRSRKLNSTKTEEEEETSEWASLLNVEERQQDVESIVKEIITYMI